ncbi:hypothetical protein PMZ80_000352 [Knufia obscura]|uniref:Uncharacterized protein n=1 Tax=Knufia obscura TaxID=1635080 RepID=A0ABR0S061_9EURO|nr:hypothetical protein PMZ80_000352 [Knufia obscura]
MTVMHHPLPSPEYTGDSDSDSDIIHELERKRRQLDEEVARFRAQKDKEFRDFEAELKARRRQKRAQQHSQRNNASNYYEFTKNSPSATPPTASMLSGCEKKIKSHNNHHGYRQSEPMKLIKSTVGSKVTPPTICLDKLNIKGESILQSHANALPTPTTPTLLASMPSIGRKDALTSTEEKYTSSDSASIHSEPPRDKPPLSPGEKSQEQTFAGLFAPAFLPLLDARNDRNQIDRPIEGTQTEPASPIEQSLTIDSVSMQSCSLPTESLMSESLQVPNTRRAYTSPIVNRGTLPPIIRNINGRKRVSGKRKHVTFQLADRAIVEPSSSYEEGLSPNDISSDRTASNNSTPSISSREHSESPQRPPIQRRNTPRDPFGRGKRDYTPISTPECEVGMSMGDLLLGDDDESQAVEEHKAAKEEDGYFSPRHGSHSPAFPSPSKTTSFDTANPNSYGGKRATSSSSHSPSRKTACENASGPHKPGYGYTPKSPRFSPLTSPTPRPSQMQSLYPGHLEEDFLSTNNNVCFFELDEELDSPTAGIPRPDQPEDKEDDVEPSAKDGKKSQDRDYRHGYGAPDEIQTGTSVPINIVRPGSLSNSWVGTFGH